MNSIRALLVGLLCSSAGAAETAFVVPKDFQGLWDTNQKACGTISDMRLEIREKEIRFYETQGSLKAIVTNGPYEIALIAELSGEGETWLQSLHFRLSKDKKSLTDVALEKPVVRHRCVASKGK